MLYFDGYIFEFVISIPSISLSNYSEGVHDYSEGVYDSPSIANVPILQIENTMTIISNY